MCDILVPLIPAEVMALLNRPKKIERKKDGYEMTWEFRLDPTQRELKHWVIKGVKRAHSEG